VPVRTVRYYIGAGLLPSPEGRGRTATYSRDHLLRLELIRRLADLGVQLNDIRTQVAGLNGSELERTLEEERRRSASEQAARARSPRDYVSSLLERARAGRGAASPQARPAQATETWNRLTLAPGVELHVSVDAWRRERGLVESLLAAAHMEAEVKK
jgi:DNA-binding transcriptional MerR regulator